MKHKLLVGTLVSAAAAALVGAYKAGSEDDAAASSAPARPVSVPDDSSVAEAAADY